MSEIIDNIARTCGRTRGGIFSLVAIPCDGATFTYTEGLVTAVTQTKLAKTIALDINSGKASSTQEGDRANMSSIYKESVEFTVKTDELEIEKTLESLTGGLHIIIVKYANGKNKIYGAENGMLINKVADSGTEGTDLNGNIMTGTSESSTIPPHISNTDLDAIIAFTL